MNETPLEYVARICELEARLSATQQQCDELVEQVEAVEWGTSWGGGQQCPWCKGFYPEHTLDCSCQATLTRVRGEG